MKKFYEHVRNRVLTGFIFMIPVFAIILLLQKLWSALTGAGSYLVQLVGLKSVLGDNSLPVATAIVLALLFYLCGWLVKFNSLKRVRDKTESLLLKYIPAYRTYKAQLQEKVAPEEDTRTPVWVTTVTGKRPGLLIDEIEGEAIVFLPDSPDPEKGELVLVETYRVSKLGMSASSFLNSIKKFGKDLIREEAPKLTPV